MKIHHRFPPIGSLLLLLALTACALPGLGTPPAPRTPTFTPAASLIPQATAVATDQLPTAGVTATTAATPSRPQTTATLPAAPPQPGPTVTRGPAAPAGLSPTLFLLNGVQPAPAGILPQLGVFEAGGGSGSDTPAACSNTPGNVRWCHALNGAALTVTADFTGLACGLDSGPLSASVALPDGSSRPANVSGEPFLCRTISFSPGPGDPLGVYQVTVSQGASHLSDSFTLVGATAPIAKLYNNCAWLSGLPAGQAVRILAFGLVLPSANDAGIDPSLATWRFLGEGSFPASTNQTLWVCPDNTVLNRYPEEAYLAYPATGKPLMMGDANLLRQFQGNCADGPASRLAAGKSARVLAKDLPLFADPALNTKALAVLHQGAVLGVVSGPVCPPQGPWTWQVKSQGGQTGWVAESDTTAYFVEPIK